MCCIPYRKKEDLPKRVKTFLECNYVGDRGFNRFVSVESFEYIWDKNRWEK